MEQRNRSGEPRDPNDDEDLERYESWRHRPADVPPRSYLAFRERASSRGRQWSTGRGVEATHDMPDHAIFRDDRHGSDTPFDPEDEVETYVGPMRRYRRVGQRFRAQRGPHAGVGPAGYRRADERIQEDVCEFLTEDGLIDASGVEVSVEDGEVTLEGTVSSRAQKRRAEDLTEIVLGVVDVHNRLRLGSASR
jgi:osmotically-inducible protein OsmY